MDTRRIASIGVALALVAAPCVAQESTSQEPTQLPPLTVTTPVMPLDRSLQMLRILVEQSAPCLGCNAIVRQAARPTALRLLSYLLMPTEPPPVSEADRLAFEIKLKDSPELEFLRP